MVDTVKYKPHLDVTDLFLLAQFDGRKADYNIPEYALDDYGRDYTERVAQLQADGYLRFAEPKEALQTLTIPKLKEILREHGQKISGNKDELITRITANIAAENFSAKVPQVLVATAAGRRELETRTAYLENRQENYGFLNSEIARLEGTVAPEEILERLFAREISACGTRHDFGSLYIKYFSWRRYLKKRGRTTEALTALLSAVYIKLTGMEDGNSVTDYQSLSYFFTDTCWRELDAERTVLKLSDEKLCALFNQAVKQTAKVTFSYFTVADMQEIILERLRGEENLLEKFAPRRREPQENSPAYTYFQPASLRRPIEISTVGNTASGCLLPCLMIFLTVLALCK